MPIVEKYDPSTSLRDKILFVLSMMEKASPQEVASEIMELDGISSEEGVADITLDIEKELEKMLEEETINKLKEHRQKIRYVMNGNATE